MPVWNVNFAINYVRSQSRCRFRLTRKLWPRECCTAWVGPFLHMTQCRTRSDSMETNFFSFFSLNRSIQEALPIMPDWRPATQLFVSIKQTCTTCATRMPRMPSSGLAHNSSWSFNGWLTRVRRRIDLKFLVFQRRCYMEAFGHAGCFTTPRKLYSRHKDIARCQPSTSKQFR